MIVDNIDFNAGYIVDAMLNGNAVYTCDEICFNYESGKKGIRNVIYIGLMNGNKKLLIDANQNAAANGNNEYYNKIWAMPIASNKTVTILNYSIIRH